MMYLMHLNDFYEFDSIKPKTRKNIEILRKFDSVRFGSIFQESSRDSLYNKMIHKKDNLDKILVPLKFITNLALSAYNQLL